MTLHVTLTHSHGKQLKERRVIAQHIFESRLAPSLKRIQSAPSLKTAELIIQLIIARDVKKEMESAMRVPNSGEVNKGDRRPSPSRLICRLDIARVCAKQNGLSWIESKVLQRNKYMWKASGWADFNNWFSCGPKPFSYERFFRPQFRAEFHFMT